MAVVDNSALDPTGHPRTLNCYPEVNPLLGAVTAGDEAVVIRILVESGSDLSTMVKPGDFERTVCPTPLHQACFDGRLDLVQVIERAAYSTHCYYIGLLKHVCVCVCVCVCICNYDVLAI